jgi:hypothetical protein
MLRLARSRQITRDFNAPAKTGPEQPMINPSSGCAFSWMTVKDVKSHAVAAGKRQENIQSCPMSGVFAMMIPLL